MSIKIKAIRAQTTHLTLALYLAQVIGPAYAFADPLPGSPEAIQAAVGNVDQANAYQAAIQLGKEAKIANIAAAGVWGVSAATCGYNCFNYLVTLRAARKKVVEAATRLNTIVLKVAGPKTPDSCEDGIPANMKAELTKEYNQIVKANEGAEAKTNAGQQDKDHAPDISGGQTSSYRAPHSHELHRAHLLPLPLMQASSWFIQQSWAAKPDPAKPSSGGDKTKADGDKTKTDGDKSKSEEKKDDTSTKTMSDSESVAGYAKQMAAQAKNGANLLKQVTAEKKAAEAAKGGGGATEANLPNGSVACGNAYQPVSDAADALAKAAADDETQIANVIKLGTYCNYTTVAAGAVDAGLSFALTKDTAAGIIGSVGAAPGVAGLATSFLAGNKPSDFKADSSGIISCLSTATSLVEVAVKTVEIKNTEKSTEQNQDNLNSLQGGGSAWLEWFLRKGPLGIPEASAATEPALTNACSGALSAPMEKYSCGMAGDVKLRARMANVPGGGAGLLALGQALFGVSPNEFLSTTAPMSTDRVIGMMTKNYPQLAPRISSVYAAAERRARELSKMPTQVRQDILARETQGMLDHAAASFGQTAPADAPALDASAAGATPDAFANPLFLSPEAEDSSGSVEAVRKPAEALAPLPPPPGLGVAEISPVAGHTIFELVSRTLRDHRELYPNP